MVGESTETENAAIVGAPGKASHTGKGVPGKERPFPTGHVTILAAGTRQYVTMIRSGQTVTIEADDGNTGDVYIGNREMTATNGFPIFAGGSVDISLEHSDEPGEYVKIYADAATTDDVLYWAKV